MFQQISIYWVGNHKDMRVAVRYASGATYDVTRPVGNTNPIQLDLPASDKGDPAAIITIDTRPVEGQTE
jgi:hypothetical protein